MDEFHLEIFGHRVIFCVPEGVKLQTSDLLHDSPTKLYKNLLDNQGNTLCKFFGDPREDPNPPRLYLGYARVRAFHFRRPQFSDHQAPVRIVRGGTKLGIASNVEVLPHKIISVVIEKMNSSTRITIGI